jgi:hypothetical protein
VGLLGAALVGQSGRPWKVNPCNSWGNHHGWCMEPLRCPHPREEWGRNQCAYCHQEGH